MIITLLGVYVVILDLITLTLFQGHRCLRNVNANCVFLILVICSLNKGCMVAKYFKKIMHNMMFVTGVYLREIINLFLVEYLGLWKNLGIFSDTINVINRKLCMVVLLIELYLFIPLSVTRTVFQGHNIIEQFLLKSQFFLSD